MKNIYGMAKCFLDLSGSRARNFELDFVRLLLAAERDRDCAEAFIAAPLREHVDRVAQWNQKYAGSKPVVYVPLKLSEDELAKLVAEKKRQNQSNRREQDKQTRKGANADFGGRLCEELLASFIAEKYPHVKRAPESAAPVLPEIKWDYFGTLTD
jgi:hypothetical protein